MPLVFRSDTPATFRVDNMVISVDLPPVQLRPIPDLVIPEDTRQSHLLDLGQYFRDDSPAYYTLDFALCRTTTGDPVMVSLHDRRWLSVDALTGEENDNWTGEIRLKVACSDCYGLTTLSNEFSITVANADDVPVITSRPAPNASAGEEYLYNITAVDGDRDPLAYSLVDGPSGMSLDPRTGVLRWRPDARGECEVYLNVHDGKNFAFQRFKVTVWKNTAPRMVTTPPEKAAVGQPYVYEFKAVDDEGDVFWYELLTKLPGMTFDAEQGRLSWVPARDQNGTSTLKLAVTDRYGASSVQEWKVLVADWGPTVAISHFDIADWDGGHGGFLKFWGRAAPGAMALQRVEARLDGGQWQAVNGTTSWNHWINATGIRPGVHTIEVRAFDGEYSEAASLTFDLEPESVAPGSGGSAFSMSPAWAALLAGLALGLAASAVKRRRRRGD